MNTTVKKPLPVQAWLALLAITGISLVLGEKFGHASWMPVIVALVIWIKGSIVAQYFLESYAAHRFITWLLRAFVAFAPVALLVTTWMRK